VIRPGIRSTYRKLSRALWHPEQAILREYMRTLGTKKLNIGCGDHLIEGWLNCGAPIYPLDASKPFPLANDTFELVFSEHMIEHIPYPAGRVMLQECFRAMKPSGTIRISTPDLRFLIDLYNHPHDDYIRWATSNFISWAPSLDRAFVINNFVRDWGHQFIYDEPTLSAALRTAGFVNIVRQKLQESNIEPLRGLENGTKMPSDFLSVETMTLEATKPLAIGRSCTKA
jgi:predicted SAM-dependent methyltransferase